MQQHKLASILLCAVMFIVIAACNNESETDKAKADDTTSTSATETTTPVPASTIVTTPQSVMIVTHTVKDFDKWLVSYDSHDSVRLANGIHSYVIARGVKDPNTVMVVTKVDDIAKAKAFGNDTKLKDLMQKAGVVGKPTIVYSVLTYQDTATIPSSTIRGRTTFTVKDWAAWQKSFDEGKQNRIDNGLSVRAVGHEVDNDKKVTVVTALMDTAKVFNYWKSDELKKRMEASGVTTKADRWLFNVVKRY